MALALWRPGSMLVSLSGSWARFVDKVYRDLVKNRSDWSGFVPPKSSTPLKNAYLPGLGRANGGAALGLYGDVALVVLLGPLGKKS